VYITNTGIAVHTGLTGRTCVFVKSVRETDTGSRIPSRRAVGDSFWIARNEPAGVSTRCSCLAKTGQGAPLRISMVRTTELPVPPDKDSSSQTPNPTAFLSLTPAVILVKLGLSGDHNEHAHETRTAKHTPQQPAAMHWRQVGHCRLKAFILRSYKRESHGVRFRSCDSLTDDHNRHVERCDSNPAEHAQAVSIRDGLDRVDLPPSFGPPLMRG
jgi:hypothetical protein